MLGIDTEIINKESPNGYFAKNQQLPTIWGNEWLKESCDYLCTGQKIQEEQNGTRYKRSFLITTSLKDRTGLRGRMAEIDAAGNE